MYTIYKVRVRRARRSPPAAHASHTRGKPACRACTPRITCNGPRVAAAHECMCASGTQQHPVDLCARYSLARYSLARYSLTRYSLTRYILTRYSLTRYSLTRYILTRYILTRYSLTRYILTRYILTQDC
jgi:hypothetical protein